MLLVAPAVAEPAADEGCCDCCADGKVEGRGLGDEDVEDEDADDVDDERDIVERIAWLVLASSAPLSCGSLESSFLSDAAAFCCCV